MNWISKLIGINMSNKSLNFWKLISTFVLLPPWVLLGIGINLTMIAWAWVSILLSWHLYYKSCSWDFHSGKKWKMRPAHCVNLLPALESSNDSNCAWTSIPSTPPLLPTKYYVPSPSVPCLFFAKIVGSPANWTKRAFA